VTTLKKRGRLQTAGNTNIIHVNTLHQQETHRDCCWQLHLYDDSSVFGDLLYETMRPVLEVPFLQGFFADNQGNNNKAKTSVRMENTRRLLYYHLIYARLNFKKRLKRVF
jgi:hypothetical protein